VWELNFLWVTLGLAFYFLGFCEAFGIGNGKTGVWEKEKGNGVSVDTTLIWLIDWSVRLLLR
jgi:hypothetical protein